MAEHSDDGIAAQIRRLEGAASVQEHSAMLAGVMTEAGDPERLHGSEQ